MTLLHGQTRLVELQFGAASGEGLMHYQSISTKPAGDPDIGAHYTACPHLPFSFAAGSALR
jgi:hypothetical protein